MLNLDFTQPLGQEVTIELLDLNGKLLSKRQVQAGSLTEEFYLARFAKGMYFIRMKEGGYIIKSKKIVKN